VGRLEGSKIQKVQCAVRHGILASVDKTIDFLAKESEQQEFQKHKRVGG
jgi:hypothetical protein